MKCSVFLYIGLIFSGLLFSDKTYNHLDSAPFSSSSFMLYKTIDDLDIENFKTILKQATPLDIHNKKILTLRLTSKAQSLMLAEINANLEASPTNYYKLLLYYLVIPAAIISGIFNTLRAHNPDLSSTEEQKAILLGLASALIAGLGLYTVIPILGTEQQNERIKDQKKTDIKNELATIGLMLQMLEQHPQSDTCI